MAYTRCYKINNTTRDGKSLLSYKKRYFDYLYLVVLFLDVIKEEYIFSDNI